MALSKCLAIRHPMRQEPSPLPIIADANRNPGQPHRQMQLFLRIRHHRYIEATGFQTACQLHRTLPPRRRGVLLIDYDLINIGDASQKWFKTWMDENCQGRRRQHNLERRECWKIEKRLTKSICTNEEKLAHMRYLR